MKILIIEDDKIWQLRQQMVVESCEIENIVIASNIEEAHKAIYYTKIDLIIADIFLDNENIFDLYKTNKQALKIPTIFVTAEPNNNNYKNAEKLEQFIFLGKPILQNTLKSAINTFTYYHNKQNQIIKSNETSIIKNQFNEIFKVLSTTKLLEKFNIGDREIGVIFDRMQQNKTFREIGEKNGYSAEVSRKLFYRGLNKLKSKIKNAGERYNHFLEFTKLKKNKLEITKTLTNLNLPKKSITKEDILKNNIDELELLGTKWKNILHEKGIHYIEDLVNLTKKQILLFPNFGQLAVSNIELELSKYGLELKK
jgi:response regulator of citrate/malate metabolism